MQSSLNFFFMFSNSYEMAVEKKKKKQWNNIFQFSVRYWNNLRQIVDSCAKSAAFNYLLVMDCKRDIGEDLLYTNSPYK